MGLLLVKELIMVDKEARTRAGEVRMRGLPYLKVRSEHAGIHASLHGYVSPFDILSSGHAGKYKSI